VSEILSLALRPQRLSDMLGQKVVVDAIRKQMAARPPRSFMFSGGPGLGKTSIARIIAVALQCPHQTLWGDPCQECRGKSGQFAIQEVNASECNGVEEIAQIAETSKYEPMPPSLKRVIILDESQRISSAGQGLLLKYFEDPPEFVTWIICTTDPQKIIAPLQRRCMKYTLKPLSIRGVEFLLERSAKKIGLTRDWHPLAEQLHTHSIGSPALVLMALEKYAAGASETEAIDSGADPVNSLAICKAVSNGDWITARKHLLQVVPEDSRYIRASVMGWMRGWLFKEGSPVKADKVATCLQELSGMAPLEDSLLHSWLIATLYQVCRRLKGA
jgi:replication-associated recombination protein RarA